MKSSNNRKLKGNISLNSVYGITLMSLIITIIILLILAGVVINMLLGKNSILKYAKIAKEKYENAANQEVLEISKLSNEIDNYIPNSKNTGTLKKIILASETYLGRDGGNYSYNVSSYPRF